MIEFLNKEFLFLLLLIIPVSIISVIFFLNKFKILKKLQFFKDVKKIILLDFLSLFSLILAIVLIIIALAGPYNGKELIKSSTYGREVVFLVDVSNSMLAEDLYPNRLQQAKQAIKDCIDGFSGNQVALVAFGGNAVIKVPFTTDYNYFLQVLYDLSPNSVSRGGTRIGDALRKVDELLFIDDVHRHRDIVLISDGEDQDSYPVSIASRLANKGVRMLLVGLGNQDIGGLIPVDYENGEKQYLHYRGELVYTKLDTKVLEEMASASENIYFINVADNRVDLGGIFREFIKKGDLKKIDAEEEYSYNMVYKCFLIVAMFLILISATIRRQFLL